jgi:hypothetical protein
MRRLILAHLAPIAAVWACSSSGPSSGAGVAGASDDGGAANTAGATNTGGATNTARATGGTGGDDGGTDGDEAGGTQTQPITAWPTSNPYSWDGSWTPSAQDFPLSGLLDPKYDGTHAARDGTSPSLPPGDWDWNEADDDLANWGNFADNVGTFAALMDGEGRQYGWELALTSSTNVDVDAKGGFFHGSSGTDVFNLGPDSRLASFAEGNLGDGPDILVFNTSSSLDFRTGSTETGSLRDNDLVVAGCVPSTDASYLIQTTTIHTGPGSDWVFIRDWSASAIDLGNGANGRTDAVDPDDGDDLVVIRGNSHDFRIYGGNGNDTVIWYVDDNVHSDETGWLGPNFFGTGGAGDALWGGGTDRLVLVVPSDTPIVDTDDASNGTIFVKSAGADTILDDPTQGDPYARYCVECGTGPEGRKTLILSYRSGDGRVFTAYSYLTDFEELQVGVGSNARVYRLDDVQGIATLDTSLDAVVPPSWPSQYCGP